MICVQNLTFPNSVKLLFVGQLYDFFSLFNSWPFWYSTLLSLIPDDEELKIKVLLSKPLLCNSNIS